MNNKIVIRKYTHFSFFFVELKNVIINEGKADGPYLKRVLLPIVGVLNQEKPKNFVSLVINELLILDLRRR